ncbi:MAG: hypothetical protein OXE46_09370 [Chloroflexi bacterium]|nr:hypothetical protein [Chloroflexota bacterium]
MASTQAELAEALRRAESAADKRDAALQLLARTNSRALLDECLRALGSMPVLATLDESHRPALRRKCLRYFEEPRRDKAGLLREALTRLLVHIAHPDDGDIFQLGLETYHLQPVTDVAQNLRAVALAGLAPLDSPLALLYAVRFLGEEHTSVFNCEPAMTALDLLAATEQHLPIYPFLLRAGEAMAQTGRGELVGKALESLGADFPAPLYAGLMAQYSEIDQATASMGIINCVVEGRGAALYDQLEMLILQTQHVDLRRYGLVMMAAARDDDLSERLLRMARVARLDDVPLFIEALEICQHDDRDELVDLLRRRL